MKTQLGFTGAAAIVSLAGVLGLSVVPAMAAGTATTTHDTAVTHQAALPGTIALRDGKNPKDMLGNAKIEDLAGNSVGSVDDIMLDANGKVKQIKADVGGFLGIGSKDVALNANALKFDPNKKVLITSMTKDQLKALPEFKG